MSRRERLVAWTIANAIAMSLGFLVFIQTLMFLSFGLNFEPHWSSQSVDNFAAENPEAAEQMLRTGLLIGLPLAGAILASGQALVMQRVLPRVRTWILAGPLGFASIIALIWPLTAIWGDIPGPVEPFAIVAGGLLMTGVIQWWQLRRMGISATRWLVLWLAGLPLGMVVFMLVYTLLDRVVFPDSEYSIGWAVEVALIGLFIGGTAAAISGKSLFRAMSLESAHPGRPS